MIEIKKEKTVELVGEVHKDGVYYPAFKASITIEVLDATFHRTRTFDFYMDEPEKIEDAWAAAQAWEAEEVERDIRKMEAIAEKYDVPLVLKPVTPEEDC